MNLSGSRDDTAVCRRIPAPWSRLRDAFTGFWPVLCVVWLCVLATTQASAQAVPEPVRIDPALDHIDLSASTWLLEDPEGKMTLEEVRSASNASRLKPGSPRIGFSASAHWLRFTVVNPSAQTKVWWLDTGDRTLQELDFFVPDQRGVYQRQSAGSARPFADRPVPTASFVFPFELPAVQAVDIFLRVRSTGYLGVLVSPMIWQPEVIQARERADKTQWLLYLGMALAMGAFNLLLYFSIRDVNYLLYVMSLLFIVWGTSSSLGGFGSAYEYFWPSSPVFEQTAWMASIAVSSFFSLLFIVRFLELRRRVPRLLVILIWFFVLFVLFEFVLIIATGLQLSVSVRLLQWVYVIQVVLYLPYIVATIYAILKLAWSGMRQAKFIAIAWMPLIVAAGTVGPGSKVGGLSLSGALLMWASAFELIMMSLALADRFNQARLEKAQAQAALVESLQKSEHELEGKVAQRTQELQQEQTRTKALLDKNQDLLHNMLPVEIAEELSSTGSTKPARHESATILFTDFSGFTQAVSTMPADRMVAELNDIFAAFDDITDECGVEKIKTIGDAYMAAAGLPKPCADHAQRCVRAGLRMVDFVEQRNKRAPFKWQVRVGIHSGPVVAGVVGKRKYAFDIWGDSVNVASRMESSGEAGRVNVSAYTYDLIQNDYACEYRGKVDAKGKGSVDMYFVTGARSS